MKRITHDIQGRPLSKKNSEILTAMGEALSAHSLSEAKKKHSK